MWRNGRRAGLRIQSLLGMGVQLSPSARGNNSVVEYNLPKVGVAGPNPVSRSLRCTRAPVTSAPVKVKIEHIMKKFLLFVLLVSFFTGCAVRIGQPKREEKRGVYHTVKKGETLYRIALTYGVPVDRIKKVNRLKSNTIEIGDRLFIPGANEIKSIEPLKKAPPKEKYPIVKKGEPKKGTFLWPAKGQIALPFGKDGNIGIDILLPPQEKVYPSREGKIFFVGKTKEVGNTVIVDHFDGYYTIYGKDIELKVKEGEVVNQEKVLGIMLDKESPVLHFEIRKGTQPVNPLDYLP